MTDVIDQLRLLGEAAETYVEPVTADEVVDGPSRRGWGRPTSDQWLGAAAVIVALVAIAAGVTRLMDRGGAVVTTQVASESPGSSAVAADPEDAPTTATTPPLNPVLAAREGWEALRQCESGGDYSSNVGNNFYGAYWFELGTWFTLVKDVRRQPHEHPPAVQDAGASALYERGGSRMWPICGKFIEGSMGLPVVAGWVEVLDARRASGVDAIVFMKPDVTAEQQARVEQAVGALSLDVSGFTYVDKDAAFAEFQELFADSRELVESVTPDVLPPSLRIDFGDAAVPDLAAIRELPGVLRVVGVSEGMLARSVTIDLGQGPVELAVDEALSASVLRDSPVRYAPISAVLPDRAILIAGHSVLEADPFFGIGSLRVGDPITLTVNGNDRVYVVTAMPAEVNIYEDDPPDTDDTLTLTAEGSDPSSVLVVTAELESTSE